MAVALSPSRTDGLPSATGQREEKVGGFAYVSLYYEVGVYDWEYFIGVRVLMHSVKRTGSIADRVVMVSPDTPQNLRTILMGDGVIVREVPNIATPYGPRTKRRFQHVLNKLHAWTLVSYDRVMLLDADNLIVRNADVLFQCGSFCGVFLNAVSFHTGLLVIKPDASMYNTLVTALQKYPSYDGADQGFLNSYFPLQYAPMFNLTLGGLGQRPSDAPAAAAATMYRLPVHANMHHIYYYEAMSWGGAFGGWDKIITIGYPVPQIFKPWCWWAYPLFSAHWLWHEERCRVDLYLDYPWRWVVLLGVIPCLCQCCRVIASHWERRFTSPVCPEYRPGCAAPHCTCINRADRLVVVIANMVLYVVATALALYLVPCYVPYALAWMSFVAWQTLFHYALSNTLVLYRTHRRLVIHITDILLSVAPWLLYNIIISMEFIYFHFVAKILMVAVCAVGVVMVQNHLAWKVYWDSHVLRLRSSYKQNELW